jgi:hypothetical protein
MKIGIVLHGNLRTFLMPFRENPGLRICDQFVNDIVRPNNADVFAFTDTKDFFYDGVQYHSAATRRIELQNGNAFRLYDKVDFIDPEKARGIIDAQVRKAVGPALKALHITGL